MGTIPVPVVKHQSLLDKIGGWFKFGAKKALLVEAKLLPAEQLVAGIVQTFNPVVGTTLLDLLSVVGNVEQVAVAVGAASGTGLQKLQVAAPGIEQAILSDPIFKGKTITNLDLWNKALYAITGSLADLLRSTSSSGALDSTPSRTLPAPVVASTFHEPIQMIAEPLPVATANPLGGTLVPEPQPMGFK